ncbi:MAG: ABC transporter substrate-binding protein [Treponema sp.]|jgi:ABC-type glycerol-3-phosphate transport system substrate-binding protein|nr:ABC transporter substrate-binding protein [Treponema sp.]
MKGLMMENLLMEKAFFWFAVLAVLLIMAGCGGGGDASSRTALSPNFFDGEIKGEITISAYDSFTYKIYLEEAALGFQALYPGTKVNIEIFSALPVYITGMYGEEEVTILETGDDTQSRQDYLSRINTKLMSGTGADLYAMDILPLHKYVESKTLENLELYMNLDPGFNKLDYRQNIFEALRYKDGIWFMPMNYSFFYFDYDPTLVTAQIAEGFSIDNSFSTEDLLNLGNSLHDGSHQLFRMDERALVGQLLKENMHYFINLDTRRVNFLDGRFTALLNAVRNYAEQSYISHHVSGELSYEQLVQNAFADVSTRYYFRLELNHSLIELLFRNFPAILSTMGMDYRPSISEYNEIAGIHANADGLVPFKYWQGFGMNSQSKNKATAWTFIKYLLSKELQIPGYYGIGLGINNEARAEGAEFRLFGGRLEDKGTALSGRQRQALEEYVEEYKAMLEKFSDRINTFAIKDENLDDMIRTELGYYFAGTRSAEEIARILQNRVDLYLSE